jgi:transposase-like protein
MSEWTIAEIRAALVRTDIGLGRPYPEAARTAAVDWAERRQREGHGWVSIASELGVSPTTLRKWQQERRGTSSSFCPVKIVEPASSTRGIVVHAPGELRIEGLSVAELAELVRRLV